MQWPSENRAFTFTMSNVHLQCPMSIYIVQCPYMYIYKIYNIYILPINTWDQQVYFWCSASTGPEKPDLLGLGLTKHSFLTIWSSAVTKQALDKARLFKALHKHLWDLIIRVSGWPSQHAYLVFNKHALQIDYPAIIRIMINADYWLLINTDCY